LQRPGLLILSEFAGAAVELHGALLVNPYDANAMSETLYQALTMGADEIAYRSERLAMIVEEHDVTRWGEGFLAALEHEAPDDAVDGRSAA
jgi:trehalose-6-phosphate synthase